MLLPRPYTPTSFGTPGLVGGRTTRRRTSSSGFGTSPRPATWAGLTPEEIAASVYPELTLAQVDMLALAYYEDHHDEINRAMQSEARFVEQFLRDDPQLSRDVLSCQELSDAEGYADAHVVFGYAGHLRRCGMARQEALRDAARQGTLSPKFSPCSDWSATQPPPPNIAYARPPGYAQLRRACGTTPAYAAYGAVHPHWRGHCLRAGALPAAHIARIARDGRCSVSPLPGGDAGDGR